MPPNVSTSTPASMVSARSVATAAAERGRGVGDPGAVHVHPHAEAVGDVADRGDLVGGVDRAQLGALGDRDDAGLGVVRVADEVGRRSRRWAGVSLASSLGRSISLAPRIRSGAPVSSTAMCDHAEHTTASAGPSSAASASTLAPVPLNVSSVVTSRRTARGTRPRRRRSTDRRRRRGRGRRWPGRPPRRTAGWAPAKLSLANERAGGGGRGIGPASRPAARMRSVRKGRASAGRERRSPFHYCAAVSEMEVERAGPGGRAATHDGRAPCRPGRAGAPAARRLRHGRRPRRGGDRRCGDRGAAGGQARLRRVQRAAGLDPARPRPPAAPGGRADPRARRRPADRPPPRRRAVQRAGHARRRRPGDARCRRRAPRRCRA